MLAYMLLNCSPGDEKEIISEIKKIPQVSEVNGIMGRYDIFVKITGEIPGDIDLGVVKIRSIKGITNSYSMTALYEQGGTIDTEIKSENQIWKSSFLFIYKFNVVLAVEIKFNQSTGTQGNNLKLWSALVNHVLCVLVSSPTSFQIW